MAITGDSPVSTRYDSDWHDALAQTVAKQTERLIAIRRHFHQHPELSGRERQTSLQLKQWLEDIGASVRLAPGECGLVADLSSEPTVGRVERFGMRADLDALRIEDCKQVDYRSRVPGVMHACGHDAHSAILLGTLLAIRDLIDEGVIAFPVHCRAIFQPAEETSSGAREMIRMGALEDVAQIVALHVDPSRDVGRVGLRRGVLTSNCDEIQIAIHGRGGHAARPHEARDPVAAAAQLINALYSHTPRLTNSQDAVVLTLCQVEAGDNANVIPESVKLRGTLRTLDEQIRLGTMEHIAQIARGVAQITQTRIEVGYGVSAPSVVNDRATVDLFRRCTVETLGEEGVEWIARPSMGSEDFAMYLQQVPGALARLGSRGPRIGGRPLHSPDFDIDERALPIGSQLLAAAVLHWSEVRAQGSSGS